MSFGVFLLTAVALILIIEGLLYALFTTRIKALMLLVLSTPERQVSGAGWLMAGLGLILLGLLQTYGTPQ